MNDGFKAGGKTAYAAADDVSMGSGNWTLDDALLGDTTSDRRIGSHSARVRNAGRLTMNFNAPGAVNVSVAHAVYGTDGSSGWELWKSIDNGVTWAKSRRNRQHKLDDARNRFLYRHSASAIRFEVGKVSGGTNRIDIDNEFATENRGLNQLTATERRILKLVADEKTSREIGEQLYISHHTVETHRTNISRKVDLQGSLALVKFAVAHKSEF